MIHMYCIIFLIISVFAGYLTHERLRRRDLFSRYDILMIILDKCSESAYNKIFLDELLPQINSGYRISQVEMAEFQKSYVKLVTQYCGTGIIDELIEVHGGAESLASLLAISFFSKVVEEEAKLLTKFDDSDEVKPEYGNEQGTIGIRSDKI